MSPRSKPAYSGSSPLVSFSERVRALREARGWSQEELAHRAGRHFTFVSQIERAERAPGLMTIIGIAEALAVDPGDLITRRPFSVDDVEKLPTKSQGKPRRRRN